MLSVQPLKVSLFIVQAEQVKPVSLAVMVRSAVSPTPIVSVPTESVVVAAGELASMTRSPPDSVRVVNAALVLPAASERTRLMKSEAPDARSVLPSTTV